MAIALDASSPALKSATSGTSLTSDAFTPPAGSLVVVLASFANGQTTSRSCASSDSATWTQEVRGAGSFGETTIWSHYYPTSPGSITVTASWAGSPSLRTLDVIVLTGVDPTAVGNVAQAYDTSTPYSLSITTGTANSWIVGGIGVYIAGGSLSPVAGWTDHHGVTSSSYRGASGYRSTTTAQAYTVGWSSTGGFGAGLAFLEVRELQQVPKTAGDTYTVTDAATAAVAVDKTSGDTFTLLEAATAARMKSSGDTFTLLEAAAASKDLTAADSYTLTEAASTTPATEKSSADTFTLLDASSASKDLTVTDSYTVTDTATRVSATDKTSGDTYTVTDTATAEAITPPILPYTPPLPIAPPLPGLGYGAEYRVSLHDTTGVVVAELDCTNGLAWSRALSEVSRCQLAGTTAAAQEVIDRVRPWVHWVSLFRGDDFVWTGLVTDLSVRSQTWTLTAKDLGTLMWRTRTQLTRTWIDTDPVRIAAQVWDSMCAFHSLPVPAARIIDSTTAYTVESVADRRMLHQAMDDLVKLGAEWTVIGSQALFLPTLRTEDVTLSHTQLADCDFDAELEVLHDGTRLFTDVRFQGKNYAATATVPLGGLRLQTLVSMDGLFGEGNITRAAQQTVAKTGTPRRQVLVPSGAKLTPDAPITMAELVPGIIIPVWTDVSGGVRDLLRLEGVEVTVDAGTEAVKVTLGEVPDPGDAGVIA